MLFADYVLQLGEGPLGLVRRYARDSLDIVVVLGITGVVHAVLIPRSSS